MKKQPAITAQTKQNLIDAFWSIYTQKPIQKITIKEITVKAGYNRSTFYEYFTDVYDILEQIENTLITDIEKYPLQHGVQNRNDKPLDFSFFFKFYESHRDFLTVLLGENGNPAFQLKMKNSLKPQLKHVLLETGIKDDFRLDLLLDYNISAMNGVLFTWFTMDPLPPLEDFIKLMSDITIKGSMTTLEELIRKDMSNID